MDEMELVHNHPSPLHGKRIGDSVLHFNPSGHECLARSQCGLQHVVKESYICFLGLLCLLSGEVQALDL